MNNINANSLKIWFEPWHYTDKSWVADMPKLNIIEQTLYYPHWCDTLGIEKFLQKYNYNWAEKFIWLISSDKVKLAKALEMLGIMLNKGAKHNLSPDVLRWCHQTSLARPIILNNSIILTKCKNAFEFGLNLLAQVVFCYAKPIWTRFLLSFEQSLINDIYIHPYPFLSGPMLLILEKRWQRILLQLPQ